jgi:hypothetical protein
MPSRSLCSSQSAPSRPPDVIASIRHPRRIASSTEDSVSLVSPENDDAITNVCGPAYSGNKECG